MYKIYIDGLLVHNDNYQKLMLANPELEIELNQPGSLKFSIYPTHERFYLFNDSNDPQHFNKMKSIVEVWKENKLEFRGRILENENGFYTEKQVICEGELAFLIDSQLMPYSESGTPAQMLGYYLAKHNEQMADYPEKQFVLGTVSDLIKDGDTSNTENIIARSSDEIVNTWNEINSKLLSTLGGYLIVDSTTDGKRQINWLHENDFLTGTQEITYGQNLLDLKVKVKGDEIATAIIPVGAEITTAAGEVKKRLDITSLADETVMETDDDEIIKKGNYIYSKTGVERYGLIFSTQTWDDVTTDVSHLLRVAIAKLNETKKAIESIEIKSVDLNKISNGAPFRLGTRIKVNSKQHGLEGLDLPVTKLSLNLTNPASNVLTLTKTERTFTETTSTISKNQSDANGIIGRVESVEKNVSGFEEQIQANADTITATNEILTSVINQTSEQIITEVSEKYTLKDETETLLAEVNTKFQQTSDEFELRFNETTQNINDIQSGNDAQFQEISKYIKFIDGNILLGEEGNQLTLVIKNDRISFMQNGAEVAYFSNRKLYVLDGEFLSTLKIGNFSFIPRTNGNVSFKKVT